jgi:hypothetical protein
VIVSPEQREFTSLHLNRHTPATITRHPDLDRRMEEPMESATAQDARIRFGT